MNAPHAFAAPPWIAEHTAGSCALVNVEPDLAPGTVLERSPSTGRWQQWDGYEGPACGVLLRYEGRHARVVVADAVLIGRHLRSGSLGRRGCNDQARRDLAQRGIAIRG